MKQVILILTLCSSLNVFAGPSVSGGVSEAPWVVSQIATQMVLNYAQENTLAIESIRISGRVVTLKSGCGNGTSVKIVFNIQTTCRAGSIAGICIPERALVLDEAKSSSCQ